AFLDQGLSILLSASALHEAHATAENVVDGIRDLPPNVSFRGVVRARATPIHVATNIGFATAERWVTTSTLPQPCDAAGPYVQQDQGRNSGMAKRSARRIGIRRLRREP